MKKHIITALAVSALIAGAATTAHATPNYAPPCDSFARYSYNPHGDPVNSTPLTDPSHWQLDHKPYDGSPTGVLIHQGNGNGSYFFWAPTAPCPDETESPSPSPSVSIDPHVTITPSPSPEPTTTTSPSPDPQVTVTPDPSVTPEPTTTAQPCPVGTVPGAPDDAGNFVCQNDDPQATPAPEVTPSDEPVVELHDELPAARAVPSDATFTG